MTQRLNKILLFACLTTGMLFLFGCGEYQQILKSKDPDLKFQKALMFFEAKQYVKSQTLLDEVTSFYRGTERSEEILIYLSRSYMGQKDYTTAAEYYQAYIRNYPKGKHIVEARFQAGHCYYLNSPDARLDQTETKKAIEFFTQFIELYPTNPYVEQASKEMGEMYDKLAYKEYLSAKLYYNLGTYLGNNYLSAEITAKNALKEYPTNKYQEDLNWLILQSKYQQTINSVDTKVEQRARETEDEYYNFITEYPNSKHIDSAHKIAKDIQKYLKE